MKVFELYSKRQKKIRGEVPEVYQYDTIPIELRTQVVHILNDVFVEDSRAFNDPVNGIYKSMHNQLCREYGLLRLIERYGDDRESVLDFLLNTKETEKVIDVIEIAFFLINRHVRNSSNFTPKISIDGAIEELNYRFREHGVGYQYESGKIIRIDSQLIHSEVVKPALNLLSEEMYKGANAEFLSAHEHYRIKKYKECLNDCLKAFESCMKAICDKRKWKYDPSATAKSLLDIIFKNELIPTCMQTHFSALRSTLKDGVPTVRNNMGAHGQGSEEIQVPESLAAYLLHLTASNILLLASADKEIK